MITRLRSAWPLVALVLAAAAVGCNHAVDTDAQGSEPVSEAAQAAEATTEGGGFHGMLGKGLDKINLRADQQAAVEKIRANLRAQGEPVRAARQGFVVALADRVAAGNVDEAGLAAPIARISRAAEAFEPAFQGSLASLHAALDPAQRQALVAELRGHRGQWHGRAGHKGHRRGMRRRLERLAAQLSLAADQVATIRASLEAQGAQGPRDGAERPQEERGERMHAVADAFPGEAFDPAALGVGKELPEQATARATHEVRFYAAVVPALNAAQRTKLAESLRSKGGAEQGAAEEE
jgi:Spy/CpxP family protein refolding chaperone